MTNEMANIYQHKLKQMLQIQIRILSCNTLKDLLLQSEKQIKNLMGTQHAVIYLTDINKDIIYRYNSKGDKISFSSQSGIAGYVSGHGKSKNIADMYNNTRYNGKVDLDTSMPVLVLPIKNSEEDVLSVIEVVNLKGCVGRAVTKKAKLDHLDDEMLRIFCDLMTQAMARIKSLKKLPRPKVINITQEA